MVSIVLDCIDDSGQDPDPPGPALPSPTGPDQGTGSGAPSKEIMPDGAMKVPKGDWWLRPASAAEVGIGILPPLLSCGEGPDSEVRAVRPESEERDMAGSACPFGAV